MKKNIYLLLFLLTSFFTACKKDDLEYKDKFEKSYQAYLAFKAANSNSYRYTTNFSSWTGLSTTTTVTVENGIVTGRSYQAKSTEYTPSGVKEIIRESWTEDTNTLNSHTSGDATLTLDEIYERARTIWLVKRSDVNIYLETKNDGMLSTCGFVPHGCQDDCFTGIYISSISKI